MAARRSEARDQGEEGRRPARAQTHCRRRSGRRRARPLRDPRRPRNRLRLPRRSHRRRRPVRRLPPLRRAQAPCRTRWPARPNERLSSERHAASIGTSERYQVRWRRPAAWRRHCRSDEDGRGPAACLRACRMTRSWWVSRHSFRSTMPVGLPDLMADERLLQLRLRDLGVTVRHLARGVPERYPR
jgi:hypothetical protein